MLHQALVVEKWIEKFDSKNVNSFFYSEDLKRDPKMVLEVQTQFKTALMELDGYELSPNLAEINKHLLKTKDMLNLD